MRNLLTLILLLCSWACASTNAIVPSSNGETRTNKHSDPVQRNSDVVPKAKKEGPLQNAITVDVFDIRPENVRKIKKRFQVSFDALRKGAVSDEQNDLPKQIKQWGDFAYVQVAEVNYGGSPNQRAITFDIVDSRDVSSRTNFMPRPTDSGLDPGGILALWKDYYSAAMQEIIKGNVGQAPWENCPAFHCILNHEHPALKVKSKELAKVAPSHFKQLVKILHTDRNENKRAAAAFLIAYHKEGSEVIEALLPNIRDSSLIVRNNTMRVLAEIALRHQDVPIPLSPILKALRFPATTDRNKAAAILDGLLQRPGNTKLHRQIIAEAGDVLLAMLRLKQPNNHDYAYFILKKISAENFGEWNNTAWAQWLDKEKGQ